MQVKDNAIIAKMFSEYVTSMEDKPRHTEQANAEVDAYDQFCIKKVGGDTERYNEMFDKMMNVAVEFEESGFIAGFKYAMMLQEAYIEENNNQALNTSSNCMKLEQEVTTKPKEHAKSSDNNESCITTKQIAEMFETTNFKVVRRIEKQIFPFLDQETMEFFSEVEAYNVQHKPLKIYKLNRSACNLYLKEMESKRKNYINIAGGYAKLQELMEKVFPAESIMVTA